MAPAGRVCEHGVELPRRPPVAGEAEEAGLCGCCLVLAATHGERCARCAPAQGSLLEVAA